MNLASPQVVSGNSSLWARAPKAASATQEIAGDGITRDLAKGETLIVERSLGQAVLCSHGALWITCEAAAPGAEDMGPRLRVQALTDACVSVLPAPGAGKTSGPAAVRRR